MRKLRLSCGHIRLVNLRRIKRRASLNMSTPTDCPWCKMGGKV